MDTKYFQAILKEVVNTRLFQFVSSVDEPRTVEFLPDGRIGLGANDELGTWEVAYDERRKTYILSIKKGNFLVAYAALEKEGVWKGKDRRTRSGTALFRPLPNGKNKWVDLSSETKFYDDIVVDEDEESFRYIEPKVGEIDWSEAELDLSEHVTKEDSDTAIAIIAHNRPTYLKQVVQSIAGNTEQFPIYVFIDHCEDHGVILEQTNYIKKKLPSECKIIHRPLTLGCGRNIIDARRQLFDNLGYEKVFVCEDDLVLSPQYFSYCLNLMEWAEKTYSNVGAVQGWAYCTLSVSEKKQKQNQIHPTFTNWWSYLLSKRCWDTFKEMLYSYERLFLYPEYAKRPHRSIRSWFKHKRSNTRNTVGDRPFGEGEQFNTARDRYFTDIPTGQDAATTICFHQAGWVRLAPVVNRGRYVGRQGIHMNPNWFERAGFSSIDFFDWPSDEQISKFIEKEHVSVLPGKEVENDAEGFLQHMKHVDLLDR